MSSENVSAMARRLIFCDRAAEIRAISDAIGSMCLPASLAEVGSALGGRVPRFHEAKIRTKGLGDEIGEVSKEKAFTYIMIEAERMGIKCTGVVGTPWFLASFLTPAELRLRVLSAEGNTSVAYPNIVLMTTQHGLGFHAQAQLGDDRSQNRVSQLEGQGCKIVMVVEFERTS